MGIIKNVTELRSLREAGRVAGLVCDLLMVESRPGVSTVALEEKANQLLAENRSLAPFKGFDGFGHAICVSINDEIVNGPPSHERILREADVVSIAVGSEIRGMHGKAARTAYLGDEPPEDVRRLLNGTRALFDRIQEPERDFKTLREILALVPEIAREYGLSISEGSGGCGIGKKLHDAPPTPNNPDDLATDVPLTPGLAFTLMPMMSLGASPAWKLHEDKWTHVTEDGSLAAHFAETILVTADGLEILTRSQ